MKPQKPLGLADCIDTHWTTIAAALVVLGGHIAFIYKFLTL